MGEGSNEYATPQRGSGGLTHQCGAGVTVARMFSQISLNKNSFCVGILGGGGKLCEGAICGDTLHVQLCVVLRVSD